MRRVRAMEGELRAGRSDNLLLFGSRKLTENSLSDGSWRLDRQRVHEHVRGGRHVRQLARDSRRLLTSKHKDAVCTRNCSPGNATVTSIPSLLRGVQWRMQTPRGCFPPRLRKMEIERSRELRGGRLQNSSATREAVLADHVGRNDQIRPPSAITALYVIAPQCWGLTMGASTTAPYTSLTSDDKSSTRVLLVRLSKVKITAF